MIFASFRFCFFLRFSGFFHPDLQTDTSIHEKNPEINSPGTKTDFGATKTKVAGKKDGFAGLTPDGEREKDGVSHSLFYPEPEKNHSR
ncbi:MAG: hypothetical protein IJK40_00830, partial [Clostridia bacterium]|nr:hypothetical protein [Clostridia bacterium]